MDRQTVVFITDRRQEKLANLLGGERVSNTGEEKLQGKEVCEKVYVLPTPVAKLNKNPVAKEKLKQELIKAHECEAIAVKVFGGVFDQEWTTFLEGYEIPYWDFMKLPEVVEGNAWITAEATLAECLKYSSYSICGQNVLMTGYGCCGKKIAELFSLLGAHVVVAARRSEVREEIRRDGYKAISFVEMPEVLSDIVTVINTVPALVLTEDCIRRLPEEAVIVDIASNPGGTDFDAAQKYGITAKLALGLPGIYTTSSSALLLKRAISQYAPLPEKVGEDKLWIFQIII